MSTVLDFFALDIFDDLFIFFFKFMNTSDLVNAPIICFGDVHIRTFTSFLARQSSVCI